MGKIVSTYTNFNHAHDRIEYSIYVQDEDMKYRLDGVLKNTISKEAWESGTEVLIDFSKYITNFKLELP